MPSSGWYQPLPSPYLLQFVLMHLFHLGLLPGLHLLLVGCQVQAGVNLCHLHLSLLLFLLLLGLHGLPQASRRRFDQSKVPLHLFDIFGLLYFLGHFHPLEDVMCLPLVLDLLYSLHGIDGVLPKLTIVLNRNIPFLFKLKAGINSQLLAS